MTETTTEPRQPVREAVPEIRWFRHGKQKTLHAHVSTAVPGLRVSNAKTLCLGVNENLPFALVSVEESLGNRCRHCEHAITRAAYEPSDICVVAGRILSRAYRGLHHCAAISDHGWYASVNVYGGIATFDGQVLTDLVIGAHDEAVRLEIEPAGPHNLKLLFHQRVREGDFCKRHPTMEAALEEYRRHSPDGWKETSMTPRQYVKGHANPAKSRRG